MVNRSANRLQTIVEMTASEARKLGLLTFARGVFTLLAPLFVAEQLLSRLGWLDIDAFLDDLEAQPSVSFIATAVVVGVLALVSVLALSSWLQYRMHNSLKVAILGGVLRKSHGVLSRKYESVDLASIQSIETSQGPIQRRFDIYEVKVDVDGSASSNEGFTFLGYQHHADAITEAIHLGSGTQEQVAASSAAKQSIPNEWIPVTTVAFATYLVAAAILGLLVAFVFEATSLWFLLAIPVMAVMVLLRRWLAKRRVERFRWGLTESGLVTSYSGISSETAQVRFSSVANVGVRSNFWERKAGLAKVAIKHGIGLADSLTLESIPVEVAYELRDAVLFQRESGV